MGLKIINFIDKSNKVLLFIAAIVVIITISKSLIRDIFRQSYPEAKVQVIEHDDNEKPNLKKSYIGHIKDVHILEITSDKIVEKQSYAEDKNMMITSSSLALSSNAVNLMFAKPGHTSRLLFEHNVFIVAFSPTQIKETQYINSLSKNIYSVVRKDTNKDGFLNQDDKKELLISEYDGSNLKSVMDNIEGYHVINNDTVLLYTATATDTLYYTYNVTSAELLPLDTSLQTTNR